MARLRYTKRSEFATVDLLDIFASDEPENVRVVWRPVSRERQAMGLKPHWAIQFRIGRSWDDVGELYSCSQCGEIYPVLPGNIYDGLERCECGAEFEDMD
ncbi:MAG: hypothetical protein KatS3mg051_1924 [Anaerolineae bacterium]|nr:MAG: hypothetical protein KatS3mg051_1924 [Anaerolineae bacterium]